MTKFFSVDGLTKSYPGVLANDGIAFSLEQGEIHALLGENGSGKSTLVKTVYGVIKPDAGRMWFGEHEHVPADPKDARSAGVAMVFQHFSLFEALTVAENIALGMEHPPVAKQLTRMIIDTAEKYGLPLRPEERVSRLSAGERQRVEIIRCLLQEPKLLIMDEPTSVLTPQEADILFSTLRTLAKNGTSILYISHKLEEIRALCSAATILRAGRVVASCDPRRESARQLAELMVGGTFKSPVTSRRTKSENPIFAVEYLLTSKDSPFGTKIRNPSFAVKGGQIFGIAGVAGNGQDELIAAISGEARVTGGRILLNGAEIETLGTDARRRIGLMTAPEERLGHAAAPEMNLIENVLLAGASRKNLVKRGVVDWSKARRFAELIVHRFDVRTAGVENAASSLSGGNLQKFLIGRAILNDPLVLVVNQPTWGLDAAATAAIRQALIDLAQNGSAVVVISQDLEELIEISDVIAVLNEGRMSEAKPSNRLTREEIGLMMGGSHGMAVADSAVAESIVDA